MAQGAAAGPLPAANVPVAVAQAANTTVEVQQLEEEVRQLNGKIEDLNFQLLQMQEQMRKMQEDNEFRFQELEGKSGALAHRKTQAARRDDKAEQSRLGKTGPSEHTAGAPRSDGDQIARVLEDNNTGGTKSGVKTIDGVEIYQGPQEQEGGLQPQTLGKLIFDDKGNIVDTEIDKPIDLTAHAGSRQSQAGQQAAPGGGNDMASLQLPDSPDELYDLGYSYFQAGKYKLAEDAFEEFSSRYSDNPKIAEARFWVGESLLSRGLYEDAAKVFLDAHKKYPASRMGPQTMLKLGVSLAGMNQRELACATFAEIANQYPAASGAIRAKIAAEQRAASCKAG
jgi:tol-pal system protein YbgF